MCFLFYFVYMAVNLNLIVPTIYFCNLTLSRIYIHFCCCCVLYRLVTIGSDQSISPPSTIESEFFNILISVYCILLALPLHPVIDLFSPLPCLLDFLSYCLSVCVFVWSQFQFCPIDLYYYSTQALFVIYCLALECAILSLISEFSFGLCCPAVVVGSHSSILFIFLYIKIICATTTTTILESRKIEQNHLLLLGSMSFDLFLNISIPLPPRLGKYISKFLVKDLKPFSRKENRPFVCLSWVFSKL